MYSDSGVVWNCRSSCSVIPWTVMPVCPAPSRIRIQMSSEIASKTTRMSIDKFPEARHGARWNARAQLICDEFDNRDRPLSRRSEVRGSIWSTSNQLSSNLDVERNVRQVNSSFETSVADRGAFDAPNAAGSEVFGSKGVVRPRLIARPFDRRRLAQAPFFRSASAERRMRSLGVVPFGEHGQLSVHFISPQREQEFPGPIVLEGE